MSAAPDAPLGPCPVVHPGLSCAQYEIRLNDLEKEAAVPETPCPTCSGPSRETVGMVCQTCGTDYAPDAWLYPRLPDGIALHVCLTCGAAVPAKGIDMHEQWHRNAAGSAIDAHDRIDQLEKPAHTPAGKVIECQR